MLMFARSGEHSLLSVTKIRMQLSVTTRPAVAPKACVAHLSDPRHSFVAKLVYLQEA